MKIKLHLLPAFALLIASCSSYEPSSLRVDYIRLPHLTTINSQSPLFSWQIDPDSEEQVAYQIIVTEGGKEVWDSGRVESDNCAAARYNGTALSEGAECRWRVRYWDKSGVKSRYSTPQQFYIADEQQRESSIVTKNPLMRRVDRPVDVQRVDDMTYLYDFGRSAFGTIGFEVECERDEMITLHLGEQLTDSGRVERSPKGTIRYTNVTVPIKKGVSKYNVTLPIDQRNTGSMAIPVPEEWGVITPYRYVEVCGVSESEAASFAPYRDVMFGYKESLGKFDSSNELLNDIWEICRYTIEATDFLGYYIDGDRERIPYEADAYINQLSHYCVDSEYAIGKRSLEYFMTHATWPTEWLLHTIMIAYQDYIYTGDTRLIEQYYTKLKAKTLYELAREDGLINAQSERATPEYLLSIGFKADALRMTDIVDWPPAAFKEGGKNEIGERDGHEMMPINTVVNAFHYHALRLMGEMAAIIGKSEDSDLFSSRAAMVKESINTLLFDKERGIYIDGEGSTHSSLHSNMMPLAFGVVDEENIRSVVEYVKSRGLACSVYGAQYLFEALYTAGESDYALELLTNKSDRSWYNMLRLGSTMTLEAWDLKYKGNLDWNHAWGAAPANIIPRYMWGVQPTEVGYKRAAIKPQLSTLEHSSIDVPTLQGVIHAE